MTTGDIQGNLLSCKFTTYFGRKNAKLWIFFQSSSLNYMLSAIFFIFTTPSMLCDDTNFRFANSEYLFFTAVYQ